MTKADLMKKCGLVGAGVGVGLFAIFGLLQGAVLGGAAGVAVGNYVFGPGTFEVMAGDLLPRITIAVCMLAGIGISFAVLVLAGAGAGVAVGYLLGLAKQAEDLKEGKFVPEAVTKGH